MISVVTVSYNSYSTIERTFNSILNQKYNESFEYIVIDGDSTDGTKELLKKYESIFINKGIKYRWISEKDNGIYYAMNKGINMSNGDIIGILNSDDYYEDTALLNVENTFKNNLSVGIVYGILRVVMKDGTEVQIYRNRYENYLLNLTLGLESAAQHPTCFVSKLVYEKIGLFDTTYRTAADYEFLLRAMRYGIIFYAIDSVISNFTKGGVSDKIDDLERFKQRWDAQYKHKLMTKEEYDKKNNYLKYKKIRNIKERIIKYIFKNI
jgi:glycosyltransferase involved in cell wall biosynthesis